MFKVPAGFALAGGLLICACLVGNAAEPPLPADLDINPEAGRGQCLIVNLRIEEGKELAFVVDTGASNTVFDQSLQAALKENGDTVNVGTWDGADHSKLYIQPALYAGEVRLKSGSLTAIHDFKPVSLLAGRQIAGVLGMDCLRNYCIQLDFVANKMRFLDRRNADRKGWGTAFPLSGLDGNESRLCIPGDLLGEKNSRSLIDAGDQGDGWLTPAHFREWKSAAQPNTAGQARSPDGILGGEHYFTLSLRPADVSVDGVGLRFLARHLVTFDFPGRMMYLRRRSDGPLPPGPTGSAMGFLMALKEKNLLPGWSKGEHGSVVEVTHSAPNSEIVSVRKGDDPALYHYTVVPFQPEPWKLLKAWRTDQDGRVVETYPVR